MLTCKQATELLLEFLDNSLEPREHGEVRDHLNTCKPCGQFFASYKKTVDLCRKSLCKDTPDGVGQRLMAFLKRETAAKQHR